MDVLYGFGRTGKLHKVVKSTSRYQSRMSKCGAAKIVGSLYEDLRYNTEYYDCCKRCFPYVTTPAMENVDHNTKEWCRRIGIRL
jgi:hypothetical protein